MMVGMAKSKMTVFLAPETVESVMSRATREERSFSAMTDIMLREAALAERDGAGIGRDFSGSYAGETKPKTSARSASAEKITAAGANGDQPDPPTTRVAVVKEAALAPPAGAASAKSKKKPVVCSDVTHGRSGWRCKTCGEFAA